MDQVSEVKEVTSKNQEELKKDETQSAEIKEVEEVKEERLPQASDVGVARPIGGKIELSKKEEVKVEAPIVKDGTLPQASDVGKLGTPIEVKDEEKTDNRDEKPEETKAEEYKVLIECKNCDEEFKVPVKEYKKGVTKCKYCGAVNSLVVIEGRTLVERETIEKASESKTLYITNVFLTCPNCNIRWLEKTSKACPRCGNDKKLEKSTEEVPYARL